MNYQNFNQQFRPDPNMNNMPGQKPKLKSSAPEVFIDDNLFVNIGRKGEFHLSFPDSKSEQDRVYRGTIKEATKDHIIIYDENARKWYMLPLLYLNYAVFNEWPNVPDSANWHGR